MPRPRNTIPSYSHHKPTDQAYVRIPDGSGGRRAVYLGKYDSPESRAEYARIVAELAVPSASVGSDRVTIGGSDLTVNEVLLAFARHAERHYRRADGTATNEVVEYKYTFRLLRETHGHIRAREFGPLALKAVRQKMVEAGWQRTTVNNRVRRLKHVFKWAVENELVPSGVYQALAAVAGLQKGRSAARESEPVGPVDDATVDATLPFLTRHVRGLVEFQRLSGCRPGEACQVRRADIDTGGDVWQFRPAQHKNSHRSKPRVIAVGPRTQALLREFFTTDLGDYLFSPRRAVEEFRAERSAKRTTPRFASHMERNAGKRVACPKRRPAERYTSPASRNHRRTVSRPTCTR
jgi:integrase